MTDTGNAPNEPGGWGTPAGDPPPAQPTSRTSATDPGVPLPAALDGTRRRTGAAAPSSNGGTASRSGKAPNGPASNGNSPTGWPANGAAPKGSGGAAGDLPRGVGRYERGAGSDPRARYERRSVIDQPPPNGYQALHTRSGVATTGPGALGAPAPTAGAPVRVDGRLVRVAAPPLGPATRSRRVPARRVATALPRPVKPRKLRLIEKFGGRRLHHHASVWRRIRSFVGVVLIALVIAAVIATVVAVIVGAIALAVQHALHG